MPKLPDELDDPIDNLFKPICEAVSPPLKSCGHTPNLITTYSLITGVAACYALYKGHFVWFAVLFMISYFFDCLDGYFARKYQMTSKFGDTYDHAKDFLVGILLVVVVWYKYRSAITWFVVALVGIILFLDALNIGCQQKWKREQGKANDHEASLETCERLCPDSSYLRLTRFMGTGVFNVAVVALVAYVWCRHR